MSRRYDSNDPTPRTTDAPRVGPWVVGAVLGQGWSGPVRAVVHAESGVEGALKRTRTLDPLAEERMRIEVEVLGRVDHPRLVRVLDHGSDADGPWLVLERLGASAAATIVSGQGLPSAEVARLGDDVLAALGALHAAGVLHRDIKPANVLRDAEGGWKLADLGTARRGDSNLTETGTALGTPAFMAPEQRYGARSVGTTADLYAVGATIWSVARGAAPFELHAAGPEAWTGLPPGARDVLHRATRLEPEARWPSAEAMRKAWADAVRESSGDASAPAPQVERAPRPWRAGLIMGALAGLALLAWRVVGGPPEPQPTAPPTALAPVVRNVGPREGARFGASLASGADIGAGPAEDIAIGMPGEDVGGAVALRWDGCCDAGTTTVLTANPGIEFGTAVALVARTNEAVRGGIVVGGPRGDGFSTDQVPATGQVYVKGDYEGTYGGVIQRAYARPHGEAGTTVSAWWTGQSLRVAYGAPGVAGGGNADGGPRAGAAVIVTFPGPVEGAGYKPVHVFVGEHAHDRVGTSLAYADLDGDGKSEIIVGSPGAGAGAGCVRAFQTDADPGEVPFSTGVLLGCGEAGEAYGSALASAGDTDGDGRDEVWIGAPGGAGSIVRVDLGGVRATVTAVLPGEGFGAVIHARPDLPGSLWVGAPEAHAGAGHVWVYTGLGTGDYDAGEAFVEAQGSVPEGAFGAAIVAQRDLAGGVRTFVGAPGELRGTGRVWEVGVGD